MATVKERFDALLEKKKSAETQIVQLKTRKDSAQESMTSIENEWKESGIGSYEEAKEKVAQMENEIDATLTKCEEYLEEVGV